MKKLVLLVSAFTTGLLSMGCNNDDSENAPALLPELKIDGETTIVVPYSVALTQSVILSKTSKTDGPMPTPPVIG